MQQAIKRYTSLEARPRDKNTERQTFQAYMHKIFSKVNATLLATPFGAKRLYIDIETETIDSYCENDLEKKSALCKQEMIWDTGKTMREISEVSSSIKKNYCLVFFLGSKSKRSNTHVYTINHLDKTTPAAANNYHLLPEDFRTFSKVPHVENNYKGGMCDYELDGDHKTNEKIPFKQNISYIDCHGLDKNGEIISDDILEDNILYRLLLRNIVYAAGFNHINVHKQTYYNQKEFSLTNINFHELTGNEAAGKEIHY
uniref:Uncharacterized protein n=1 Tax=Ditylenchus dipsaci TaxID=166011 RepID=A0A915DK13_9BILA